MSPRCQLLFLGVLLSGCMHSVHQVAEGSFEDVPRQAQLRPIEAEAEQSVFIATGNTDFADQAMQQLAARCPDGRVVGVQARHSTSLGFLVHTNRLKVTGYCLEDGDTTGESAAR
jgi:hypothetical protein